MQDEKSKEQKVIKADVIEAQSIVIRDKQGRSRISMSCIGAGADITIYDANYRAILIVGVYDYAEEEGQGQCLSTPAFYITGRNQDEDPIFSVESRVQNNQLLPTLTMARGKGFPDYALCPHDAVKGVTPQKFAEYKKLLDDDRFQAFAGCGKD